MARAYGQHRSPPAAASRVRTGAAEATWSSHTQQDYGKRYGRRYWSLLRVTLAEVTETLR
eukprot:2962981-Prymnesium_polylepis.1